MADITSEQQAHILHLQQMCAKMINKKYIAGAKEHGGNIWDMPNEELLDQALDEAIDQVVYLLTLKDNLFGKFNG